jgi:hypothetical protein
MVFRMIVRFVSHDGEGSDAIRMDAEQDAIAIIQGDAQQSPVSFHPLTEKWAVLFCGGNVVNDMAGLVDELG